MALATKEKIVHNDVINGFWTNVYDVITTSSLIHSTNLPVDTYGSTEYKEIDEALGNVTIFRKQIQNYLESSGVHEGKPDAARMLSFLVECTHMLTRVGTWRYTRLYHSSRNGSHSYSTMTSASGRALFADSYIKTLNSSYTNGKIKANDIMSISKMNDLYTALNTAWANSGYHQASKEIIICHSVCHSDCHHNCHSNNGCYK
jgi:hypothetical protein